MKVLFTLISILFSGLVLANPPLTTIVAFGDSMTDNGKLYEHMEHRIPQSPPYFEGRFTNGLVWVEDLTASYFPNNVKEHLLDYAYGGAGVSDEKDGVLFTLTHELDMYLDAHQGKADANSLFIVWIGANNYLSIPSNFEKTLSEVNEGITRDLQRLADKGARHILVLNAPDLGRTPIATDQEAKTSLSYFSNQHNILLLNSVERLQQNNPQVQWIYFDVSAKLNELLETPELYGFHNITDTCFELMMSKNVQKQASALNRVATAAHKDLCDGYLFFDPIHPTALAHKILAEKARAVLDAAGVEFVA